MAFDKNEKIGIAGGLDYYDRKELCDLYNESDSKAFEYLESCADGEWAGILSELSEEYDNTPDYRDLKKNKEYQAKLWKLMEHFGCFRNKYGEAFTKY